MPIAPETKSDVTFEVAEGTLSQCIKPTHCHMELEIDTEETEKESQENLDSQTVHKHTVIIFDWDDTLLASSCLSSQGLRLDSELEPEADVAEQLKLLEKSVISVLSRALEFGEVHVITNAETGWVQMSAQKFIPGVVPFLDRVSVISARSTYERMYPEAPLKWKFHAFQDRLKEKIGDSKSAKNIISFGDSHVEREAVRAVTRGLPNTITKSVKFAERPSMEQLRRQIELVTSCFQFIYNHQGDLDLMLTISLMQEVCS